MHNKHIKKNEFIAVIFDPKHKIFVVYINLPNNFALLIFSDLNIYCFCKL